MKIGPQARATKAPSPLARSVKSALAQQLILIVLAAMILDGGRIAQICLFGFVAFWTGALLLIVRAKGRVTKADLVFIEGGSIVVCLLSYLIASGIWKMRNVW